MANENASSAKLHAVEFTFYFLSSTVALLVDYGSYRLLVGHHLLGLPQAAATGYAIGLIAAYFIITAKVFTDGWLRENRVAEALLFSLSGALGIALTFLTVTLYVSMIGEHVNSAKTVAVVVSFIGVYLFRKFVVFKKA